MRQIGGVYFIVTVDYSSSSDGYEVSAFDAKTGTTHRLTVSADEVGANVQLTISTHIFSVQMILRPVAQTVSRCACSCTTCS